MWHPRGRPRSRGPGEKKPSMKSHRGLFHRGWGLFNDDPEPASDLGFLNSNYVLSPGRSPLLVQVENK